jgi:uncharacterized membrane-anchored protein
MKIATLIAFVILCIAQWLVPLNMIREQQVLRTDGKAFRFKTRPVDPVDPYRGNYLTLYYDETFFTSPTEKFENGSDIYVSLKTDSLGFARVSKVSADKPTGSSDYVLAKVSYQADQVVYFDYPFERFYLEESKAKPAEHIYNESNLRESEDTAYAVVYVKDGQATIDDVKVNDKSVIDIVRENN